ncbi:hypothetical protein J6590_005472 [Homalodisca vitripennis]|nr:hypothetical protein J6590_005472 [Homalodisca vitripennis]
MQIAPNGCQIPTCLWGSGPIESLAAWLQFTHTVSLHFLPKDRLAAQLSHRLPSLERASASADVSGDYTVVSWGQSPFLVSATVPDTLYTPWLLQQNQDVQLCSKQCHKCINDIPLLSGMEKVQPVVMIAHQCDYEGDAPCNFQRTPSRGNQNILYDDMRLSLHLVYQGSLGRGLFSPPPYIRQYKQIMTRAIDESLWYLPVQEMMVTLSGQQHNLDVAGNSRPSGCQSVLPSHSFVMRGRVVHVLPTQCSFEQLTKIIPFRFIQLQPKRYYSISTFHILACSFTKSSIATRGYESSVYFEKEPLPPATRLAPRIMKWRGKSYPHPTSVSIGSKATRRTRPYP